MLTSLNSGPAVASPAPYPAITVDCQNPQYALLISQNLSGPQGEMTAIYQYMYQDWILSALHPEIAAILKQIAKVELHHLDVFGQLVFLLGGDPRGQARPNVYRSAWNGNMINYTRDVKKILSYNAFTEQTAFDTYMSQAEMIQDEHVSALLTRIAQDEKIHIQLYQDLQDMV